MSWVYLPAPEADCLPPGCLDGGPSALSRSSRTASECSPSDSATDTSSHSRSGMTSARLTDAPGADESTSSAEASPARTSAALGEAQALLALAQAFGLRCSESLARFGLAMSLPKTPRCFALEDLPSCSKGLPAWGILSHGACLELTTSVRPTSAIACGLSVPTPTCAGNEASPSMQKWPAHRRLAAMLPTPTTRAAYKSADFERPCDRRLEVLIGVSPNQAARGAIGGVFIALREWMMGWPLGWSASEPLATDRFRQWLRSHGVSSAPLQSRPRVDCKVCAGLEPCGACDPGIPEPVREQRVHSPSSIALARQCRRAWALCYVDKLRKPEVTWEQCMAHDAWQASEPPAVPWAAYDAWVASEPFKPQGGQRGAAIGTRVHLYAAWWLSGADVADERVYGPRRVIDWESLPGQILQAMVDSLPPRGSLSPRDVEVEQRVTVDGVAFRCIADALMGGVWDHKTSKDIRAYALLSHDVAVALGVPERSLRDDLQACINALAFADTVWADRESDEPVRCTWTYGQTEGKERRVLPVVQEIPVSHALKVVREAADVARELTCETSADAPANTLACDDYGGCWYRREGHCTEPRRWGAILRQAELAEESKGMAKSWKDMVAKQSKANAEVAPAAHAEAPAPKAESKPAAKPAVAKPRTAKPAAAKAQPAPEPIEEETAEATEPEATDPIVQADADAAESPLAEEAPAAPDLDLDALCKLLATGADALSKAMKTVREYKAALEKGGKG